MYIIMVYLIYVYDSNNVISLKLNETRHLPFHDNIWQCYQKVLSIIYILFSIDYVVALTLCYTHCD